MTSLYKYVTFDTLEHILDGSIRFTQPSAFNDPFELLPEVSFLDNLSEQNLNMQFDIISPARKPMPYELPEDFKSNTCHDEIARIVRADLDNSIGILCLSKTPNSLLMWSHYAQEYTGAMIELDADHEFFEGQIEIDYRECRPIKELAFFSEQEVVPISELCIKPQEWKYEQEVRIIRRLDECAPIDSDSKYPIYVKSIPASCIKSVTLGERTSVENQRKIYKKVKNTNIGLWLSAIANWGFTFRPEIIKLDKPVSEFSPAISPRTAHIFLDEPGDLGEIARWHIENHKLAEFVNKTA